MMCLFIGIVLLTYNHMMITGQVSFNEQMPYISIDNGTGIMERILLSSMHSYEQHHCPKNTLLHLVDETMKVYMCDCERQFLYFPLNDSCYEAYKQGPCSLKNYFVLPANETVPRCVENPCLEDGMVPYNDMCYPLKTMGGPCKPKEKLDINEMTFQLQCRPIYVPSYHFADTLARKCPPGTRRSLKLEVCRKVRHNSSN